MDKKGSELNNEGSTMIEVLIAFLLVSIILGALYQVVKFSSNMYMKSVDMKRQIQAFETEMYKKPIDSTKLDVTESGASLTLTLDRSRGAGKTGRGNVITAGNMALGTVNITMYEQLEDGTTGYRIRLFRYKAE